MKTAIILTTFLVVQFISAQDQRSIKIADSLLEYEKWEQAAKAFKMLSEENPVNGEFSFNLGTALAKIGDFPSAITAHKQSLETGFKKGRNINQIAINYAQSGNSTEAIKWIKKGLFTPKSIYYEDLSSVPAFEILKTEKDFIELLSDGEAETRHEQWIQDLDFLDETYRNIHFDPFKKLTETDWVGEIKFLKEEINDLSDTAIIVRLMQLMAKSGDGHTFVRPFLQGDMKFSMYPMQLYQFKEGIFVTAINDKYAGAVGSKLIAINGKPIKDILPLFHSIVSTDNSMGYKENIYLLPLAEVLFELGITNDLYKTTFTFEDESGNSFSEYMEAADFNPALWNVQLPPPGNDLPLYRSNPARHFWSKELPEVNAMYLQLNINFSMPDQDIESFYDDLFNRIEENAIENLIIDIRNCPGGNSFNNKPLIEHIIKNKLINQNGHLYTVIGRRTFSAAMNLATDLEQWTNTIFIGEPTGSKPNFVGETNFIVLPNSKLTGSGLCPGIIAIGLPPISILSPVSNPTARMRMQFWIAF